MADDRPPPVIVDWGTSNFRAYRFDAHGRAEERRAAAGILTITDGAFEAALRAAVGDWLTPSSEVYLSGMITSRNGWIETPYVFAPASLADLADGVVERRLSDGVLLKCLPGVASAPPAADVMRGEEIQAFGVAGDEDAVIVAPGTHSKWVRMEKGRISGFFSMMTGEVFAALKNHTILGRLMGEGAPERRPAAFARGVRLALSEAAGGFLHHIFTARSAALLGDLEASDIAEYLSGVVIGQEVRDGLKSSPRNAPIILVGDAALAARYRDALAIAAVEAAIGDPLATVAGFRKLAALSS